MSVLAFCSRRDWRTAPLTACRFSSLILVAIALGAVPPAYASEAFQLIDSPEAAGTSDSPPVRGYIHGFRFEAVDNYAVAEGDMVMSRIDGSGRLNLPLRQRGMGQSRVFDRWPDGIVPYELAADLSLRQITRIDAAIEHWNSHTRIRLVERTEDNADAYPDYIEFQDGAGCASWVGRIGGPQAIWVASICPVGSIIHEVGHAIGLFHEHTRPDRDQFIKVNWDNIKADKTENFEIMEVGVQTFGDYDYGSIMHYGEHFFTTNGRPTIETLLDVPIGQRDGLSPGDIQAIDDMYGTDLSLAVGSSRIDGAAEIFVSVTNQGDMGANTLLVDLTFDGDGGWDGSTTTGSWDCTASGSTMQCRLPVLSPDQVSRFTIDTGPLADSARTLSAHVEAATFDYDEANNAHAFELPPDSQGTPSGTTTDDATDTGDSSAPEPQLLAANSFAPMPTASGTTDESATSSSPAAGESGNPSDTGDTTTDRTTANQEPSLRQGLQTSAASAGGGAAHPALWLAVLVLLGWRRRGFSLPEG